MVTEEMKLEIKAYVESNAGMDVHVMREHLQYKVFWPSERYCTNDEIYNAIQEILNPPVIEEVIDPVDDGNITDPATSPYTAEQIDAMLVTELNAVIAELNLNVDLSLLKADKVLAIKTLLNLL